MMKLVLKMEEGKRKSKKRKEGRKEETSERRKEGREGSKLTWSSSQTLSISKA